MMQEIGSEFWLDGVPTQEDMQLPSWLTKYGNTVLTSSGRGAITLLLKQIHPKKKSVLLPSYICESVILPFLDQGYRCYFYEVGKDLTPNIDNINSFKDIGLFFHMGYYGFSTNSNLNKVLKSLKEQSIIIIEDVTHNLFSNFHRNENNDFYIASIRKWFGIPSGGFLSAPTKLNNKVLAENNNFSQKRLDALINKGEFVNSNKDYLKEVFLKQFSESEMMLDNDLTAYQIDYLSLNLIKSLDAEKLIIKRRENFIRLRNGIRKIENLHPLFEELDSFVCPMFFPVLIKGNRSYIRKKLTEENIFCPIHWPMPPQLETSEFINIVNIYKNVISIPCDQRYGLADMDRILTVLKTIQEP